MISEWLYSLSPLAGVFVSFLLLCLGFTGFAVVFIALLRKWDRDIEVTIKTMPSEAELKRRRDGQSKAAYKLYTRPDTDIRRN